MVPHGEKVLLGSQKEHYNMDNEGHMTIEGSHKHQKRNVVEHKGDLFIFLNSTVSFWSESIQYWQLAFSRVTHPNY